MKFHQKRKLKYNKWNPCRFKDAYGFSNNLIINKQINVRNETKLLNKLSKWVMYFTTLNKEIAEFYIFFWYFFRAESSGYAKIG